MIKYKTRTAGLSYYQLLNPLIRTILTERGATDTQEEKVKAQHMIRFIHEFSNSTQRRMWCFLVPCHTQFVRHLE